MKADEILAAGIDVLLDQFGEDIEYQAAGKSIRVIVKAIIEPKPTDAVGALIVGSVELLVSRKEVPTAGLGRDKFFLAADEQFEAPIEHTVERVLSESANHFDLLCVR